MEINRASGSSLEIDAVLDDLFTYHPWDEKKVAIGKEVRDALKNAARVIIANVPPSPDRTVALRKIREARMDCNSALTFDGRY